MVRALMAHSSDWINRGMVTTRVDLIDCDIQDSDIYIPDAKVGRYIAYPWCLTRGKPI